MVELSFQHGGNQRGLLSMSKSQSTSLIGHLWDDLASECPLDAGEDVPTAFSIWIVYIFLTLNEKLNFYEKMGGFFVLWIVSLIVWIVLGLFLTSDSNTRTSF